MRVVWTRPALRQLIALQDFIAERDPAAAFRTAGMIHDAVAALSHHPNMGRPGRIRGTRELVVGRTSNLVAYRVTEQVEILAVMHGAQDWPKTL